MSQELFEERRSPHRVPDVDWSKRIHEVVQEWTKPYKTEIINLERKLEQADADNRQLRLMLVEALRLGGK